MTPDELHFTKHLHVHSRTHAHKQRNKTTTTTTTTRINCVVRVQAIQLAINNNYSEKKGKKRNTC